MVSPSAIGAENAWYFPPPSLCQTSTTPGSTGDELCTTRWPSFAPSTVAAARGAKQERPESSLRDTSGRDTAPVAASTSRTVGVEPQALVRARVLPSADAAQVSLGRASAQMPGKASSVSEPPSRTSTSGTSTRCVYAAAS
uniref:Uncharacterized protein n=1 Tax=Phaeomonas parva TaxID=124430 RepID=A0A7S1TX06_9STRA